jgi:hypothetical protein
VLRKIGKKISGSEEPEPEAAKEEDKAVEGGVTVEQAQKGVDKYVVYANINNQ